MVNERVLALTAGRLGRTTAVNQSANGLFPCPVSSHQGDGSGQCWAPRMEKGGKRERGTPGSQGTCTPSLFCGMGWVPCVFRNGPWGPIAVTVPQNPQTQRKASEVVRISPSGHETGLSTNERIPERICSPPCLDNAYSLIPKEELSIMRNSHYITHSIPNSWAADKI